MKIIILKIIITFCYAVCTLAMKAVNLQDYGGPEKLVLETSVPIPTPRTDQILIRIHAFAVNRADTLIRKGLLGKSNEQWKILGLECAGTVHSVGDVNTSFKVGDRVMALLPGGGYAEYVAVHKDHVMRIPDNLNFTQAAAIPEVWLTSWQLLRLIAKFEPGETVLIHAAGSGIGTAAIQIVRVLGGKSIAVAGTEEKLQKAKELGANFVVNYKEEDIAQAVENATDGKGANIILDCVGAQNWERNMRSLALDGRWVLYGLLGGGDISGSFFRQLLMKRGSLLTSLLKPRSDDYKSKLVKSFSSNCLSKFESGEYVPVIDSCLPMKNTADAHKRMEGNLNLGKIVLKVDEDKDKDEL